MGLRNNFLRLMDQYSDVYDLVFKTKDFKNSFSDLIRKDIPECIKREISLPDDIYKIKVFMEHYRQLGVEAFIFLDNNSGDGTKEFLCQQEDVILYTSDQQYSSARRVAWINRLLAIYGQDRWCLVVDSDELVTYVD